MKIRILNKQFFKTKLLKAKQVKALAYIVKL